MLLLILLITFSFTECYLVLNYHNSLTTENVCGELDGVLCDKLECESKNFARAFWEIECVDVLNGENIVIAILDSGIQASHRAFEGRILIEHSQNFCSGIPDDPNIDDTCGHGTRCAGIAAGNEFVYTMSPDKFTFLGGVAPKAKLIICKVTQTNSPTVEAVEDALNTFATFMKYAMSMLFACHSGFDAIHHEHYRRRLMRLLIRAPYVWLVLAIMDQNIQDLSFVQHLVKIQLQLDHMTNMANHPNFLLKVEKFVA